ncbi:N-acetyl-D-glucosamine kinase [Phlebotomus argentipes]|uniref:N-acetyl-D-glucosamine kinase n=1 Tax=Phlebotomus argentipes TaxID=94469 RepID=UPI002892BEDB|nr:N-acetyl-D-glucosamine kinase [Phlebotomus argentipes]
MTSTYIGGVEGGATHSKLVICDEQGDVVTTIAGLGTNHWQVGIPEVVRRIIDMATRAKAAAGLPQTLRLKCLGLSLSGGGEDSKEALESELRSADPNLAESFVITNDTVGSIATVSPLGGVVLISGTGSNALLKNPDGSEFNCGGWGHMMGDEGSAWGISYRAMKTVFDDEDNFVRSPHPTNVVWRLIKEHFSVETRHDLLNFFYAKHYDKPLIAGLCSKLAKAANEGDRLSQQLFTEAGRLLAKHIIALLPRVSEDLVRSGELSIVCVGSVWQSWDLLKMGFVKEMNTTSVNYGLALKRLTRTMALGASYMAADAIQFSLPRDYAKNYELFHTHHNSAAVNGRKIE